MINPRIPRAIPSFIALAITWLLVSYSGSAHSVQAMQPLIEATTSLIESRAQSLPGAVSIHVDPPRITRETTCTDLALSIAGSGRLQSRTTVRARCNAPQRWTLYLRAEIQITGTYFVTNRRVQRGEALSLDDLDTREGDLLRHPGYLGDPSRIIDWIATRTLAAGAPLESSALRHPESIERGQAVYTRMAGPGFEITGTGQALESGSPGSTIQVRAPSGKIIAGTVIDALWIQVPL